MTIMQKPGDETFYAVTNGQIYHKVVELEKQMTRITTIFSVIALIITPIISVSVSIIFTSMFGIK